MAYFLNIPIGTVFRDEHENIWEYQGLNLDGTIVMTNQNSTVNSSILDLRFRFFDEKRCRRCGQIGSLNSLSLCPLCWHEFQEFNETELTKLQNEPLPPTRK